MEVLNIFLAIFCGHIPIEIVAFLFGMLPGPNLRCLASGGEDHTVTAWCPRGYIMWVKHGKTIINQPMFNGFIWIYSTHWGWFIIVLTTYNKMMDTYPLKLGDESNLFNLHDSS
jgi:hypothetical protein